MHAILIFNSVPSALNYSPQKQNHSGVATS